jgi:hypothetical protein
LEQAEIKIFHHDDDAYESWVGKNGGYVLTLRSGGAYMLHDSDCMHLGRDTPTLQLTNKPRRWARSRRTLADWAVTETGEKPLLCQTCM